MYHSLQEPKASGEMDAALKEYAEAIHGKSKRGAIFIGVCRGKAAEGLNFSDEYCRLCFSFLLRVVLSVGMQIPGCPNKFVLGYIIHIQMRYLDGHSIPQQISTKSCAGSQIS